MAVNRGLTPEEDSVDDPDEDDGIDDLLPADLWFRGRVADAPGVGDEGKLHDV